jgi:hypothetical protein
MEELKRSGCEETRLKIAITPTARHVMSTRVVHLY